MGTYEEQLVRQMISKRASIFACNQYAVSSSAPDLNLGEIDGQAVVGWYLPEEPSKLGTYGVDGMKTDSYLNTQTFFSIWKMMITSGILWSFQFVVKCDADAVFFPDRLRPRLLSYA